MMGKIDKLEMLKDLVQDAIDKGATSVEEIHKKIADLPFDTLEQAGLMDNTLKDKHNQLLSGIYNTIRNVNKQIGDFATDIFEKIEDGKHISNVIDENDEKQKK